jgi:hypothetical protein
LGQELPGFLIGSFGGRDVVGNPLLALIQSLGDRPPGELLQNHQEEDENGRRPDGRVGLEIQRIHGVGRPAALTGRAMAMLGCKDGDAGQYQQEHQRCNVSGPHNTCASSAKLI